MENKRDSRAKYLYKLAHAPVPSKELHSKISERLLKTLLNPTSTAHRDDTVAQAQRNETAKNSRTQFCESCRSRFIFGLNTKVRVEMVKRELSKKRDRRLVYRCLRCGHKTEFKHELLQSKLKTEELKSVPLSQSSSWSTLVTSKLETEEKTGSSSKSRAKKRKQMGSLSNMLNMKKAKEKDRPAELDLFGFMKK
ncbi:unnamed protein product [Kuraishia capsulata CBS 1993]|uniref:Uncharacterized protein n=1 Tax=Kuraishia capsulata CBS 1993 TaxID=1382522 RepID=W6MQD5_9ASCO|nr:uncharacterized protein KUCA_T00003465001 [Kuraishia capsulata CBS 1993]CDK27487.1 unnamed protein product [Kuraishia capsulata CBS 1993]